MKKAALDHSGDLTAQIAKAIRDEILRGELTADDRLPSESDLAEAYDVSRPTVREALKRLAAQCLIRTERGAFGGAFVRRLTYQDASEQLTTTSTLLLSINQVAFSVACEARYALEKSCTALACLRRTDDDLATMRAEINQQGKPELSDEAFCASDVALHRTLVDSASNPILSFHLAGAVEAMQPLMNMITFSARSREKIVAFHSKLVDAIETRDPVASDAALGELERYTLDLGEQFIADRNAAKNREMAEPG